MVQSNSAIELSWKNESILSIVCNGICVSIGNSSVVKFIPIFSHWPEQHWQNGHTKEKVIIRKNSSDNQSIKMYWRTKNYLENLGIVHRNKGYHFSKWQFDAIPAPHHPTNMDHSLSCSSAVFPVRKVLEFSVFAFQFFSIHSILIGDWMANGEYSNMDNKGKINK